MATGLVNPPLTIYLFWQRRSSRSGDGAIYFGALTTALIATAINFAQDDSERVHPWCRGLGATLSYDPEVISGLGVTRPECESWRNGRLSGLILKLVRLPPKRGLDGTLTTR